jgi:hypothetical protein
MTTLLVREERGMQGAGVAAYGAGVQIHVEDPAAHLAGRERGDAGPRWNELEPIYARDLAGVGQAPTACPVGQPATTQCCPVRPWP